MSTDALIEKLSKDAKPLQRLQQPWLRASIWLALSLPYVALVATLFGIRGDLLMKFSEARFAIEQFSALLTGFTAAIAAFATVVPGNSKKYFWLPVLPLAIWLASIGVACLLDFAHSDFHVPRLHADWLCFPGIAIVGIFPVVFIVVMLRRGAPLFPVGSTALAGLAAAGLGDFGFRLFHSEDAGLTVLIWQMGSVFLLTGIAALSGKYVLNWKPLIRGSRT